jgi:hypothetical protein
MNIHTCIMTITWKYCKNNKNKASPILVAPGFDSGPQNLLSKLSTPWATPPSFICFHYISASCSWFSLGLISDHDPTNYGLLCHWDHRSHHHTHFIGWHWHLLTYCSGWPGTVILPISPSQVPEIYRLEQPHLASLLPFFNWEAVGGIGVLSFSLTDLQYYLR